MSRSARYFMLEQENREERILNAYLKNEGISRESFGAMTDKEQFAICEMADDWNTDEERNNGQFGVGA